MLRGNWDRHLEGGEYGRGALDMVGGGGDDDYDGFAGGGERVRDWGEETRFWFERAVRERQRERERERERRHGGAHKVCC